MLWTGALRLKHVILKACVFCLMSGEVHSEVSLTMDNRARIIHGLTIDNKCVFIIYGLTVQRSFGVVLPRP